MKDTTSKGHVLLGLDFLFNLIKYMLIDVLDWQASVIHSQCRTLQPWNKVTTSRCKISSFSVPCQSSTFHLAAAACSPVAWIGLGTCWLLLGVMGLEGKGTGKEAKDTRKLDFVSLLGIKQFVSNDKWYKNLGETQSLWTNSQNA